MEYDITDNEGLLSNSIDTNPYKNEFTYLAAYSIIKKLQSTDEFDKIVLERLNDRCAEKMGVRPIPL